MFPKPKPSLTPNTYAYESEPLVKPTGFREYDARWLLGKEINLMGVQALGLGLGTLIREIGVEREIVIGHDFRSYSPSIKQALTPACWRPAGSARHRPGAVADRLFRPIRARRSVRGDGDGQPQRERLDRREDGREPAAYLRPGRDGRLQGHRPRRRFKLHAAAAPIVRRELPRAISRTSPSGRSSAARSRWSPPAATAPPARSRRRCCSASAAKSCRSTPTSTTISRTTTRTPKTSRCCTT